MKLFDSFDWSLLGDSEFQEDAVREEFITPLLNRLGYSANGPNKIIRSRKLKHHFVYIGTKKHDAKIIPDYTLVIKENPCWILDAKAPTETLTTGKNPEQAFSYAIHPEVRATRYALCNGHSLVVFDVNKMEPILNVSLRCINENWENVRHLLDPLAFINPRLLNQKPDFGLYLIKSGALTSRRFTFIPLGVPMIGKISDGQYNTTLNVKWDDDWFAATFDFDEMRFEQLMEAFPAKQAAQARMALSNFPYLIVFEDDIPEVCLDTEIGENIYSNENEDYCPFIVTRFFNT